MSLNYNVEMLGKMHACVMLLVLARTSICLNTSFCAISEWVLLALAHPPYCRLVEDDENQFSAFPGFSIKLLQVTIGTVRYWAACTDMCVCLPAPPGYGPKNVTTFPCLYWPL